MATQACLRAQIFTAPSGSTIEFAVGESLDLWHQAYNCGVDYGYIYAWIKEDATIIAHDQQTCGHQTSSEICVEAKKNGWVMPDKTVTIHMIGKHAGPPDWVVDQDYDHWWKLKPKPTECGQPVKVNVPYAYVSAYHGGSLHDTVQVGGDGKGTINLKIGDSYNLIASKPGYENSDTYSLSSACVSEISLTLGDVICECGSWVNQECVSETHRRQTRVCTPSGCDDEEREVADASCAIPTYWQLISIPVNDPDITTASTLMAKIGAKCKSITKMFPDVTLGEVVYPGEDDFAIEACKGYWLKVTELVDITNILSGPAWESPFTKSFIAGLTTFGLPFADPRITNADSLMRLLGGRAIYRYDPIGGYELYQYWPKYDHGSGTNFDIVLGEGYHISLDEAKNFVFSTDIVGKGVITECNINALPCPDCGASTLGTEISVIAEMRNDGPDGEFRFYIKDGITELSREPDASYKDVKHGAIWRVEKSYLVNLNFNMPNKTLNGELILVRQ